MKIKTARFMRTIRHRRIRKNIVGTTSRPRLSVFRSLNHIYAQIIDDTIGATITAASSLDSEITSQSKTSTKKDISSFVGKLIAHRAKQKSISKVVLDRGGYKYHGRVEALAKTAREEGLIF